jgi:hypothetical protein
MLKSAIPEAIRKKAKLLRKKGLTHREIATKLKISLGSAFKYTQGIELTRKQHLTIMRRNIEWKIPHYKRVLSGRKSLFKFKPKYSREDLIKLIQDFVVKNDRLPVKREFSNYRAYIRIFGTWNKAVRAAGFNPNPIMFAKKYKANDGHRCDSLSEKIIDDWLYTRKIRHRINVSYPKDKSLTVDFKVKDYWIEFFGLSGQLKSYDKLKKRKLNLVKKEKLNFIAIYPKDLFPKFNLERKLGFLV